MTGNLHALGPESHFGVTAKCVLSARIAPSHRRSARQTFSARDIERLRAQPPARSQRTRHSPQNGEPVTTKYHRLPEDPRLLTFLTFRIPFPLRWTAPTRCARPAMTAVLCGAHLDADRSAVPSAGDSSSNAIVSGHVPRVNAEVARLYALTVCRNLC